MSTGTATARKATALMEELERVDTSNSLDDLEMRRLARNAQALRGSDPAGAHEVLGALAGIEGAAKKVHEHYRAALGYSQRALGVLNNYGIALGRAGRLDEARPIIREAYERAPDNPLIVKNAVTVGVQAGRFTETLQFYDAWNKLRPGEPLGHEGPVRKTVDAAGRGIFRETAIAEVLSLAHETRLEAKLRAAGFSIDTVYGEPDKFEFTMYVRGTARAAAAAESKFVDRVAANDALMNDPGLKFTVGFMGTTIHASDGRAAT